MPYSELFIHYIACIFNVQGNILDEKLSAKTLVNTILNGEVIQKLKKNLCPPAFLLFAFIAGFLPALLPARLYAQSHSGDVLRQMDQTREEIEFLKRKKPGKPLIIEKEKKEPASGPTNVTNEGDINKDQK